MIQISFFALLTLDVDICWISDAFNSDIAQGAVYCVGMTMYIFFLLKNKNNVLSYFTLITSVLSLIACPNFYTISELLEK